MNTTPEALIGKYLELLAQEAEVKLTFSDEEAQIEVKRAGEKIYTQSLPADWKSLTPPRPTLTRGCGIRRWSPKGFPSFPKN